MTLAGCINLVVDGWKERVQGIDLVANPGLIEIGQ